MRIPSRLLSCLLLLVLNACGDGATGRTGPSDEAVAAMNRGVAQLEFFEYLPASVEFEKAVKLAPDWWEAKVNLSIALDFTGRVPETKDGDRLVLFLDGWIE